MQNTDVASNMQREVAGAVRAEMARRCVSQTQLAERTGWSQRAISRRLAGRVPFDVAELATVARALDVPVVSLLPPSARSAAA